LNTVYKNSIVFNRRTHNLKVLPRQSAHCTSSVDSSPIEQLLESQFIWRGGDRHINARSLPTGLTVLDEFLPARGWPQGAVTELQLDGIGIGELKLLLPILKHSTTKAWACLVNPPAIPNPHTLCAAGINLERLVIIRNIDRTQALWATEQSLRHGHCAIVIMWQSAIEMTEWRRLQLATEKSQSCCFVWQACGRPARHAGLSLRLHGQTNGLIVDLLRGQGSLKQRRLKISNFSNEISQT